MNIKYVNEVKQHLGPKSLEILTDIFRKSSGIPPWVFSDRYRAEHSDWLEELDNLEQPTLFLERDHQRKRYMVNVYALPLLEDDHARILLERFEYFFCYFKKEYKANLDKPLFLADILESTDTEPNLCREALIYMVMAHSGFAGESKEFPLSDGSSICISEQILRYQDFGEIISKFYEWHIINPPKDQGLALGIDGEANQSLQGFFTPDDSTNKPKWYEKLDEQKRELVKEIDQALRAGLVALPTMGLRTLIDLVIVEHVGDKGTFKDKMTAFEKEGLVSPKQRALIDTVLEAGNAASHRAYFPSRDDLQTCIDVIKHMIQGIYELHPRTKQLKNNTPKR
ncbi:MAG: DUF4145 domain-containing protein [Proteobacteria bacterium]|nr:DUF4145 domain-containing protein [Pseudomonadota bacterium]MBU1736962.1 DUF4145 domain-containing protein [Pseudomonadota bacterium]